MRTRRPVSRSETSTAVRATHYRPLIERWNGTGWSIVKSPTLPDGKAFTLSGVSCPSAKRCFAVGGAEFQAFPGAVIARWSGTTWSAADLGEPSYGSLTAVSCTSPSSCFATGTDIGASAELKTVVDALERHAVDASAEPEFPAGIREHALRRDVHECHELPCRRQRLACASRTLFHVRVALGRQGVVEDEERRP